MLKDWFTLAPILNGYIHLFWPKFCQINALGDQFSRTFYLDTLAVYAIWRFVYEFNGVSLTLRHSYYIAHTPFSTYTHIILQILHIFPANLFQIIMIIARTFLFMYFMLFWRNSYKWFAFSIQTVCVLFIWLFRKWITGERIESEREHIFMFRPIFFASSECKKEAKHSSFNRCFVFNVSLMCLEERSHKNW